MGEGEEKREERIEGGRGSRVRKREKEGRIRGQGNRMEGGERKRDRRGWMT